MKSPKYTDLVLDIGGVLLSYSTDGKGIALKPRTIKHALDSPPWHDYERGELSQQQCYANITKDFGLAEGAWEEAVSQLELTLKPNHEFLDAIKDLKATFPELHVHAFSNISQPDFEKLKPTIDGWGIFESVVTSYAIGDRKPDFDSYRKLQDSAKIQAHASIFVDDRSENVVTAHSLGFRGILFDSTKHVVAQLHNLLGDPVARGMDYLHRNSKNLWSESNDGTIIKTNFCQLVILECIGDREMVTLENEGYEWQFFIGERAFTDKTYPKDIDTTSLAHIILPTSSSEKELAMETILSYRTRDGLPMAYFDHKRPRCCPYMAANVLRFFYLNGQGSKLQTTLQQLFRILQTRAYEIPSRYYCQPEWLFYALAKLCAECSSPDLDELRTVITARLQERMGCDEDPLAAAMRVIAAQALNLANPRDLKTLLDSQQLDGGWELVWMWRYGNVDVKMGSRFIPTALAIKAIRTAFEIESSNG